MPFGWFQKDDQEKTRQRAQASSIEELTKNDISPVARARLNKSASQDLFIAPFAPGALLVSRQQGFEPITSVMGSAIIRGTQKSSALTYSNTGELLAVTYRFNSARTIALKRLMIEGRLAGADGIVDVQLAVRNLNWGEGGTEFTASGTAIIIPDKPVFNSSPEVVLSGPVKIKSDYVDALAEIGLKTSAYFLDDSNPINPFLTHLTALEFGRIYQAGYWPTALVTGNCSYYIAANEKARQAQSDLNASLNNAELECFSNGIDHCRSLAFARLMHQVECTGGDGAIALKIESDIERSADILNHTISIVVSCSAVGTAVKLIPEQQIRSVQSSPRAATSMVMDLASLKNSGILF